MYQIVSTPLFGSYKGGFILPTAWKYKPTISRASQMRVKALAAYLLILPTSASARVNARQKAWRGAICYKVQQC